MKHTTTAATLGLALLLGAAAPAAEGPAVLDVWPAGKVPADAGGVGAEKTTEGKSPVGKILLVTNVTTPTIKVFRPAKDKDTGAAVVVAPGGAYSVLAWDLEGEEVAKWLNTLGVTGIVLKYRVPRRPGEDKDKPPVGPLQDAQRALSLVRSKAKEWDIDPKRIGLLGFSAGGHLAASAATNYDKRAYDAVDDVDKVGCRPDFLVLIYPAYLTAKSGEGLAPEIRVTKETPPTFFAHATNDPVTPESSVRMYLALKRAGVPAELHVYASGGHGFGLRPSEHPCSTWPSRCGEWMKTRKILDGGKR